MDDQLEIERKFLVSDLPDLSKLTLVRYERYYVYQTDGIEVRVQKKGDAFEFERKVQTDVLTRETQKIQITEGEFDFFKNIANRSIIRVSYIIETTPKISIKMYEGVFQGLVRAEVEFDSAEAAYAFEPPVWFGREITENPLGRDGLLIKLNENEFRQLLENTG